jgi:hypothetical protein
MFIISSTSTSHDLTNSQLTIELGTIISAGLGVLMMLSVLGIIIISVVGCYYYTKYKKTDRSYRGGVTIVFVDDIEEVDVDASSIHKEDVDSTEPAVKITPKPEDDHGTMIEVTIDEIGTSDILKRLIDNPEMKSDKIIYAELTNFPSAKETLINNKPVDNETVIYSELSVAQGQQASQGQPSTETVMYAEIGHFAPKDKNKGPKPSSIDKVIYSELSSIRKPTPSSDDMTPPSLPPQ